jgi:hypothetical protein
MPSIYLSVCMQRWLCALLAPQRLDGFYSYLELKSLSTVGRCSVNLNSPAPKLETLERGPKTQNGNFLENGSNDFD